MDERVEVNRRRWNEMAALHEHTTIAWNLADEQLVQRPDGLWEVPGSTLPLSFSVRATKE